MTRASRSTESRSRDNATIRDIMHQARERLTVPDRATLALGLMGHLATLMNRHQMAKLLGQIEEEVIRVQDVPPLRGGAGGAGPGPGFPSREWPERIWPERIWPESTPMVPGGRRPDERRRRERRMSEPGRRAAPYRGEPGSG